MQFAQIRKPRRETEQVNSVNGAAMKGDGLFHGDPIMSGDALQIAAVVGYGNRFDRPFCNFVPYAVGQRVDRLGGKRLQRRLACEIELDQNICISRHKFDKAGGRFQRERLRDCARLVISPFVGLLGKLDQHAVTTVLPPFHSQFACVMFNSPVAPANSDADGGIGTSPRH